MYFENFIIWYLITESMCDPNNLEQHPVYIHLLNCNLNKVPEFLAGKKEIGIVLHRQFEELVIDFQYLSVTLFIEGVKHRLNIHLSTIYSIDVADKFKIEFESRLLKEYISKITQELNSSDDNKYNKMIKDVAFRCSKHMKDVNIQLIPKQMQYSQTEEPKYKASMIDIDEIIKNKNKDKND